MKKKPKIKKYPFGGLINKGVTGIASALGADEKTAQLIGSGVTTATALIPGMQDNLIYGADFLGDAAQFSKNEDIQKAGQVASMAGGIAGKVMPMFPNGGIMTGMPNAEVEKQEMMRMPDGQTMQVDGPSHDMGGIDVNIPTGTQIFSDRLKVPGTKKTFAKEAAKYKTNKQDEILENNKSTKSSTATAKLVNELKHKKLDNLFAQQEQMKADRFKSKIENDLYALGGLVKYKDGGIHIKPENRGKFTAAAKRAGMGVQEYASHVLAHKDNFSSTLVKRANFAKNAAGWKHAYGGVQPPFENDNRMGADAFNVYDDFTLTGQDMNNNFWSKPKAMDPSMSSEDINIDKGFVNNNPTINTPNQSRNFTPEIEAGVSGLVQMAPAIRDLYQSKWGKKYDKEDSGQLTPERLNPNEALRQSNMQARVTRDRIKGAVGGNAGAYLSNQIAAQAANTMDKAKIVQDFENANVGIGNQFMIHNQNIRRQDKANEQMNKARSEDIARRAVGKLSGEGVSTYKDYKAGNQQDQMIKYISNMYPNFKFDPNKGWFFNNQGQALNIEGGK